VPSQIRNPSSGIPEQADQVTAGEQVTSWAASFWIPLFRRIHFDQCFDESWSKF
jgi:hypothetical protein